MSNTSECVCVWDESREASVQTPAKESEGENAERTGRRILRTLRGLGWLVYLNGFGSRGRASRERITAAIGACAESQITAETLYSSRDGAKGRFGYR